MHSSFLAACCALGFVLFGVTLRRRSDPAAAATGVKLKRHVSNSGTVFHLPAVAICVLFLTMLVTPTSSHNWMITPSRARKEASAVMPCRGRKLTDTAAQVGPGQTFTVKWATGHAGESLLLVIHGDFENYLSDPKVMDYVNDYLAEAPENLAAKPQHKRYHGVASATLSAADSTFFSGEIANAAGLYLREVPSTDPYFIDHPREVTGHLYEYRDNAISKDKFSNHASTKYPWIDSAGLFAHSNRPNDFDTVRLAIEGRMGKGHYVVNWNWRGYADCADVDFFPDQQVAQVYGVSSGKYIYSRLDHCMYVEPKDVVTSCKVLVNSTEHGAAVPCISMLEASLTKSKRAASRIGLNFVPSTLDPAAAFDRDSVPWNKPKCIGDGKLTLYDPVEGDIVVSYSATPFTSWTQKILKTDQKCSSMSWTKTLTFRDAVLECSVASCLGISWVDGGDADRDLTSIFQSTKTYTFMGCSATTTAADASYTTYLKSTTQSNSENFNYRSGFDATFSPLVVSFAKAGKAAQVGLGTGTRVVDSGLVYSTKGAYEYGWSCDSTNNFRDDLTPLVYTYVHFSDLPCPDGSMRTWEMKVPNGLYNVTMHQHRNSITASVENRGCYFENSRMAAADGVAFPVVGYGIELSKIVEVTDGRLTFQGGEGCLDNDEDVEPSSCLKCRTVNGIDIKKIGGVSVLPAAWMPSSTNPWAKFEIQNFDSAADEIGLVKITLPDADGPTTRFLDNPRSWFLFKGNKINQAREGGYFVGTGQGAVVKALDKSGNLLNVCATITSPSYCEYATAYGWGRVNELCPIEVDCGGVAAASIMIELPGSNRIFDAKVEIHRKNGRIRDGNIAGKTLCYGVEARVQTDTQPEFIITDDPSDPIFYSTCMVQEEDIDFIGDDVVEKPPATWRFNDFCITCDSYLSNLNESSSTRIPHWKIASQCQNCDMLQALNGVGEDNDTLALNVYDKLWPFDMNFEEWKNETDTEEKAADLLLSTLYIAIIGAGVGLCCTLGCCGYFVAVRRKEGAKHRPDSGKNVRMVNLTGKTSSDQYGGKRYYPDKMMV